MLRVLDLFSGIGGFSLGLERAGMRTVAFCECDRFCRAVLEKHWPSVPKFRDVRFLDHRKLTNFLPIDVICGGFPCQDISVAGRGSGIEGERSGLWSHFCRLFGELRPRYAIVENVSALLGRGLERVLGDLAEIGYDAEWHCIPASHIGAPHRRDRIWIVAYPDSRSWEQATVGAERAKARETGSAGLGQDVADAHQPRLQIGKLLAGIRGQEERGDQGQNASLDGWWLTEPDVGRVANGVPARVDRLRSLGNAVVPQIVEIIGRAILKAEGL